jgi:hypothetical protein
LYVFSLFMSFAFFSIPLVGLRTQIQVSYCLLIETVRLFENVHSDRQS